MMYRLYFLLYSVVLLRGGSKGDINIIKDAIKNGRYEVFCLFQILFICMLIHMNISYC
jgi:hypothetical protein